MSLTSRDSLEWAIERAARRRAIEEAAAKIERLRNALIFVTTDPCYKLLGSVTHDEVKQALSE